jgi:nanoRNase/pAp phosphatase (c-di-AMP/oligoRNAs hydrolase)
VIDPLSFEKVCKAVLEAKGRRVAITFHAVGDRDGVGSAVALSEYFRDAVIVTPDFLTNNAKRMLAQAGYSKKIGSDFPEDREVLIVTDANNLEVMGKFKSDISRFTGRIIFIDHHPAKDYGLEKDAMVFNDEGYNSASSIVYEILRKNNEKISKRGALLLLSGIIADSSDFQNATPQTFRQVSELLGIAETDYADVIEYFHQDINVRSRYQLMRDIFSAKTEIVGDYILMYGQTAGSASLAAETAINFGADGSVFWAERESDVSISARLRAPLDKRLGIHLGRTMQESGRNGGGSGGGHPCAAGAYGLRKDLGQKAAEEVAESLRRGFSAG